MGEIVNRHDDGSYTISMEYLTDTIDDLQSEGFEVEVN